MPDQLLSVEELQKLISRGPFHQWLKLKVKSVTAEAVEIEAEWREEFVVNPDRRYTHGGLLAAMVDIAADYAIAARLGRPVPTVDMRVDYVRAAMPGNLTARGRIVKLGSTVSVAEAEVFDKDGQVVASGRGVYMTPQSKS